VTALDVAFVASVAAVVSAVVSPFVTLLVAKRQAQHERQMRVYDETKLGYTAALELILRKIQEDTLVAGALANGRLPARELLDRYMTDKHYTDFATASVMLGPKALEAFEGAFAKLRPVEQILREAVEDPNTDWDSVQAEVKTAVDAATPFFNDLRRIAHAALT
jgi:hypothetical protein